MAHKKDHDYGTGIPRFEMYEILLSQAPSKSSDLGGVIDGILIAFRRCTVDAAIYTAFLHVIFSSVSYSRTSR